MSLRRICDGCGSRSPEEGDRLSPTWGRATVTSRGPELSKHDVLADLCGTCFPRVREVVTARIAALRNCQCCCDAHPSLHCSAHGTP